MLGQYFESPGGNEVIVMNRLRNAMTLVELLIAVTIISMLMAVAIPLVRYALESDKLREASRQMNMMLTGARTRAIERGRPVGVWLQRLSPTPNAATEIYLAESPPPYSGDSNGARGYIVDTNSDGVGDVIEFDARSTLVASYVFPGDVIRFNRGGHYFQITAINSTATTLNIGGGVTVNIAGRASFTRIFPESVVPPALSASSTTPAEGNSFEVLRHPKRLNSAPLQLADGTIVDLRFSGVGAEGTQFAFSPGDADHVIIAFDARGALSYLFFDNAPQDVDGPVHLLLGKLDLLEDADSTPTSPNPISYDSVTNVPVTVDKNVVDQSSLWVSIGSRNGTITTAENAWEFFPKSGWAGIPGPPYFTNSLRGAREFAQLTDAMGGR